MTDRRRALVAAAAAAAVVGAVLAGILLLGDVTLPDYPSLADAPNPALDGRVAFLRHNDERACVHVVAAAGGEPRELYCSVDGHGSIDWTADGDLAVWVADAFGQERVVVDPDSGEVVSRDRVATPPLPPERAFPSPENARGERVASDHRDGRAQILVLTADGEERVVFSVDAPRGYGIWEVSWSPDGRWVLAVDSEQRVLVVDPREGTAAVLVPDGSQPVWYQDRPAAVRDGAATLAGTSSDSEVVP